MSILRGNAIKNLVLLTVTVSFSLGCGSAGNSGAGPAASKTNVNIENRASYSQSENAYTFAQNSALARELSPSGKSATEIVGNTVTESKLWQNKMFDGELKRIMGKDYAAMSKSWNIETPIRKFGDFLMMTGCEEQNCANDRYAIFIDLGTGSIGVVHIGKDGVRDWKNGDFDLPPPFVEELGRLRAEGGI